MKYVSLLYRSPHVLSNTSAPISFSKWSATAAGGGNTATAVAGRLAIGPAETPAGLFNTAELHAGRFRTELDAGAVDPYFSSHDLATRRVTSTGRRRKLSVPHSALQLIPI